MTILPVSSLTLCLLFLSGCNDSSSGSVLSEGGQAVSVEALVITPRSQALTTNLPGRIAPIRVAEVRARVAGIVEKRHFTEGAMVNKGDLLFTIEPTLMDAALARARGALARAQAQVKQAESLVRRYEPLVELEAVSRQGYDDAVAALQMAQATEVSAQADVRVAQLDLSYATVRAPINGRIGKSLVSEGSLVGQGETTPMALVQQMDPIYADFTQPANTVAVSILFSGFLALTLTPALCTSLIKPIPRGHHAEKKGLFGWFNQRFSRLTDGYLAATTRLVARAGRMMLLYVAIVVALAFAYLHLPTAFLPTEDQGYVMTDVQLAPGATYHRTLATTKQMEQYFMERPAVADVLSLQGFSFSGMGQNAGLAFVMLKDWSERSSEESAMVEADQSNGMFQGFEDGTPFSVVPLLLRAWATPAALRCGCKTVRGWAAKRCWPQATN